MMTPIHIYLKKGILHFSVNTLTKNIDSLTRYISKNSLA